MAQGKPAEEIKMNKEIASWRNYCGRIFEKTNPGKALDVTGSWPYDDVTAWVERRMEDLKNQGFLNIDYEIFEV